MTDEERALLFLYAQQNGALKGSDQEHILALLADWPDERAKAALHTAATSGMAGRLDDDIVKLTSLIQGDLDQGVAAGLLTVATVDGEEYYGTTEQGLATVVDQLMGGRDLWNTSAALWELVKTHGTVMGEHDEGAVDQIWVLFVIHRVVTVFAEYFRPSGVWRIAVEALESQLPETWWTQHSRAFIDLGGPQGVER